MTSLFVVPCYYDPARPVIHECVRRIRHHQPDAQILVVDSDSPDRSYFDDITARLRVPLADIHNRQYGLGAFAYAYRNFYADFYYLIYDSLHLNASLVEFEAVDLTTVRHWPSGAHRWGSFADGSDLADWGKVQLDKIGVPYTEDYTGLMGPMWFSPRHVLDEMDALGFWDIDVPTKYELCGMERLTGIVLEHLGYDPAHSLQGIHTSHDAAYDETYVRKLDLGRM